MTISLHRENQPAFVATMRGDQADRPASVRSLRLQLVAPLAPLMGALSIRVQGITLWLRRVPLVPRPRSPRRRGSNSCDCRYRRTVQSQPIDSERWPDVARVPSRSAQHRRRRRSRTGCSVVPQPGCRCGWSIPTAR